MHHAERRTGWFAIVAEAAWLWLIVAVVAGAPATSHGQIFNNQIEAPFAPVDPFQIEDPNNPANKCAGFNPTGALIGRCAVGGTSASVSSGGAATALTSQGTPVGERIFEVEKGKLNVFFSADYEHFQKQTTRFEPQYKDYIWRGAVGADYEMDATTLGGALRYVHDNGKFGGTGDPKFETNSYGAVAYANLAPDENSFVSASVQYLWQDFDIERAVSFQGVFEGNTHGTPNGDQVEAQVSGGYDFRFDTLTIGPILAVNYVYNWVDDYSEKGNTGLELEYKDLDQASLTSRVGAQGSAAISTSFGVLVPQVTGEYVHEFMDRQRKLHFSFVDDLNSVSFAFENDEPDRDYFEVGCGLVLQLPDGIAPFISFRTLLGYNAFSSREVTAGARFEF